MPSPPGLFPYFFKIYFKGNSTMLQNKQPPAWYNITFTSLKNEVRTSQEGGGHFRNAAYHTEAFIFSILWERFRNKEKWYRRWHLLRIRRPWVRRKKGKKKKKTQSFVRKDPEMPGLSLNILTWNKCEKMSHEGKPCNRIISKDTESAETRQLENTEQSPEWEFPDDEKHQGNRYPAQSQQAASGWEIPRFRKWRRWW